MKKEKSSKLAICVFGRGGAMTWSIGTDENIILATKAARKAKRDYKLKAWSVMPVNIYDLADSEKWAYDGHTIVNPDIVDKESESYKTDMYNQYRGAKPLTKIEVLDVVL